MNQTRSSWRGLLLGLAAGGLALPAYAQDDAAGPTRAEFAKLQNEVREQRQLIIQMLQTEQQRYDMLLRLMQGQGGGTPIPGVTPSVSSAETMPPETPSGGGSGGGKRARATTEVEHKMGAIEGKVSMPGGDMGELYVYVENVKSPSVRGKSVEIRQEGKQFIPRSVVVQTGTTVVFPNYDAIYHNVFSPSPRNAFDLGSYRAGEKPRSVMLTSPGVVDVFCNMHQKMSASVLVVPSPLYAKVRADGTFRLDNVPAGVRKVAVWGPNAKPAHQRIEVGAGSTQASFTLEREDRGAHTNKMGQAYGSYRD